MSGFDAHWLAMREPFDLAARDRSLIDAFLRAVKRDRAPALRLVDLGGGTAANFRALAPLLDADQDWTLIDWDAALIETGLRDTARWARSQAASVHETDAQLRIDTGRVRWTLRAAQLDLARSLETVPIAQFDAVVTTAFLDLVSTSWNQRLAESIAAGGRPFLATLSVDGRRHWAPAHVLDPLIDALFAAHQSGDKGFGPALGPDAVPDLVRRLQHAKAAVRTGASDWRIDASAPAMLGHLLDETAQVALEVGGSDRKAIRQWVDDRRSQLRAGALRLTVGHQDLLALPRVHTQTGVPA